MNFTLYFPELHVSQLLNCMFSMPELLYNRKWTVFVYGIEITYVRGSEFLSVSRMLFFLLLDIFHVQTGQEDDSIDESKIWG